MCTLFCIILLLQKKYSASLQHRHNWCQISPRIARCPSRANGGAPVPAPMVALPFQQELTFVRPTSVPPTPHPVHPSHPSHVGSKQPAHREPSRANGGAPVPAGTNNHPSHPSPTNAPSSPSPPFRPILALTSQCIKVDMSSSSQYDTIQSNPADPVQPIQPI